MPETIAIKNKILEDIEEFEYSINKIDTIRTNGQIVKMIGLVIEAIGPEAQLGELCYVKNQRYGTIKYLEVVGFKDNRVLLMPLGDNLGLSPGLEVIATGRTLKIGVGYNLLGRVIDGLGNPIDGKGDLITHDDCYLSNEPINPLIRKRITDRLSLGIRAIDGLLTCGRGQRMGIFSGSGVGKSTLLGMMARFTEADINVIALIGERGREVRDFIEKELGDEGLKKSVVVVAPSDSAPLLRIRGAYVATAIAEYFRDQGKDVLLLMDSLTRFARAQREIGLSIGEAPANRGFPPSVFALLPKLLERAGTTDKGTITGLYTVLVEGDDINEPITDNVRAILDGHIFLSRDLANKNHYPAIDVLNSVSRVMPDIIDKEHLQKSAEIKRTIAVYRDAEDLINIDAYVDGSNKEIDFAKMNIDKINRFLQQGVYDKVEYDDSINKVKTLLSDKNNDVQTQNTNEHLSVEN